MQSLNFENPEEAISELVKASLRMRAQAEAQAEALAQAGGSATESIVTVEVAPTGELAGIRFEKELDGFSEAILSNAAMKAYTRAAELANRATAGAVLDPGASEAVLESVPQDIAWMRENEDEPVEAEPLSAAPPETEDRLYTVDDLPPDPDFDEVLNALDADDPVRAVRELGDAGRITLVDTTKSAADIDAEIVGEIEAISRQAQEFGPEMRAIRATGENDAARVTVGVWGGVFDLEIRPAGLRLEREELADEILAAARLGQRDAGEQMTRLIAGTTFADPDDPSVGFVLKKEGDQ